MISDNVSATERYAATMSNIMGKFPFWCCDFLILTFTA